MCFGPRRPRRSWSSPASSRPDGRVLSDPGGSEGLAAVASDYEDGVREAAEECPGESIFIEE